MLIPKRLPRIFSKHNTCIILVDIWGLNSLQIQELGQVYDAWVYTRGKIAKLVEIANTNNIPIYLQNHSRYIPDTPITLKKALLESNVIIEPQAFVKDGLGAAVQKNQRIVNTANFRNYKNLVYAGYAFDACVAMRDCGYSRDEFSRYNKYIIKDAGLVQYTLHQGRNPILWPEYSKVMKARNYKEVLPWKTSEDIIDETNYFCDNFASRFCFSLYLDEFKERVK